MPCTWVGCNFAALLQLQEAVRKMPSLVILENLQLLCPGRSDSPEASATSAGSAALAQWLCDSIDAARQPDTAQLPLPGVPLPHHLGPPQRP